MTATSRVCIGGMKQRRRTTSWTRCTNTGFRMQSRLRFCSAWSKGFRTQAQVCVHIETIDVWSEIPTKSCMWNRYFCILGMTSLQCWLMEGSRQRKYQPLLERPRCESLESRIQHFVKRGRLEQEEGENGEETTVFRGKRSKHSHLTTTNQLQEQNHGVKTEDNLWTFSYEPLHFLLWLLMCTEWFEGKTETFFLFFFAFVLSAAQLPHFCLAQNNTFIKGLLHVFWSCVNLHFKMTLYPSFIHEIREEIYP